MNNPAREPSTHPDQIYLVCCWPTGRFGAYFWGAVLVLVGGGLLLNELELIPSDSLKLIWPLLLIAAGAALVGGGLFRRL